MGSSAPDRPWGRGSCQNPSEILLGSEFAHFLWLILFLVDLLAFLTPPECDSFAWVISGLSPRLSLQTASLFLLEPELVGSSPRRGCPGRSLASSALPKPIVWNVSEKDIAFLFLPQTSVAVGPALPAAGPASPQDARLSQPWVRVSPAPGPAWPPLLRTLSSAPTPSSGKPTFTHFLVHLLSVLTKILRVYDLKSSLVLQGH